MTAPSAEAEPQALPQGRVWAIFGGLMLAMLLAALDQTIVATALPTIVSDLGGAEHLSWVVTAYMLASTATTVLWGKLGDLFGRKALFITCILIFLVGSILSGTSQTMGQLIAWRAVQGVGGGGLMVLSQAIIGDVVPPRERGKYQGLFGAVFGVSVGRRTAARRILRRQPRLALGLLHQHPHRGGRADRRRLRPAAHSGGDASRASTTPASSCSATSRPAIVLVTSLGGTTWEWSSAPVYAMVALADRRPGRVRRGRAARPRAGAAAAPVPQQDLLRRGGHRLRGRLRDVRRDHVPAAVPADGQGLDAHRVRARDDADDARPAASRPSGRGQLISRTGRYKIYPILGTAITAVGLYLLSLMDQDTTTLQAGLSMFVLGAGLGMVTQVLVIAVQNAVSYRDLGTATSGTTYFRTIGSSVGVAVFGTIFANRLTDELATAVPGHRAGLRAGRRRSRRPLKRSRSARPRCRPGSSTPTPTRCTSSSWGRCRWRCSRSRSRGCCPRSSCAPPHATRTAPERELELGTRRVRPSRSRRRAPRSRSCA